jgi:hypothetical protein
MIPTSVTLGEQNAKTPYTAIQHHRDRVQDVGVLFACQSNLLAPNSLRSQGHETLRERWLRPIRRKQSYYGHLQQSKIVLERERAAERDGNVSPVQYSHGYLLQHAGISRLFSMVYSPHCEQHLEDLALTIGLGTMKYTRVRASTRSLRKPLSISPRVAPSGRHFGSFLGWTKR